MFFILRNQQKDSQMHIFYFHISKLTNFFDFYLNLIVFIIKIV